VRPCEGRSNIATGPIPNKKRLARAGGEEVHDPTVGFWYYGKERPFGSAANVQSPDEVLACRGGTVTGARLESLDLRNGDLRATRFAGVSLRRVGLADADLSATVWDGAELVACDLQGVDLRGARVHGGRLEGCNLTRLRASDLRWRQTQLVECNLSGTDLSGARWRDVDVQGGEVGYIAFEKAVLIRVRFANPRLGGAPLMRAKLAGAFLIECDLRAANLYNADLRGAVLMRCDLSDALFDGADLTGAVLLDCRTDRTDWADARR
jgi:uncharacterized protein YjbI with pentapeptide repeats